MQDKYGAKASLKHYGCMIDFLGRAELLEKACNLIKGTGRGQRDEFIGLVQRIKEDSKLEFC